MAKPLLRYGLLINSWLEGIAPSRAHIVPYERANLIEGSSVIDFLGRTGLEGLELAYAPESMRANPSPVRPLAKSKSA